MSERNTGLFIAGHVDPTDVARAFCTTPGLSAAQLAGEEAPRVGHGRRAERPFTLVRLRLFEAGGVLLLDRGELPGPHDLERHLGQALSHHGPTVYLHYDEERGAGGHALFEDGKLASREAYDGREFQPVHRDLRGEHPFHIEDEEAWLWGDIGDAVETGARPVLGPGVRTDDDLDAVLQSVTVAALDLSLTPASDPAPDAARPAGDAPRPAGPAAETPAREGPARRRDRVRGLLRKLSGR